MAVTTVNGVTINKLTLAEYKTLKANNSLETNESYVITDIDEYIDDLDTRVEAIEPETWHTLTLYSGRSQYDSATFPCRYKRQGKVVFVEGAIKGTSSATDILATLPEGYRPNRTFYYLQSTNAGRTNTLKITADGIIQRVNTTNGSPSTSDYNFINTSFILN
jgi:hypothetical protein